ncbi:MAG: hypothetical protein CMJ46_11995, partial [Planctomyces sp.]|nr:hypothetical protein [Planctomyces sp.]
MQRLYPNVICVMLSGSGEHLRPELRQRGIEYFSKNESLEVLYEMIENALSLRRLFNEEAMIRL